MTATSEGSVRENSCAAVPAERIHSMLRRMGHEDWVKLKSLIRERIESPTKDEDVEILERLFRRGEAIGRSVGGIVFRLVQAMIVDQEIFARLKEINERIRAKVRFVLREMSDKDWSEFIAAAEQCLPHLVKEEDLKVLELVFRLGESVSNIEVAALALDAQTSNRRLIEPEVARRNASIRGSVQGGPRVDPQEVYFQAKKAIDERAALLKRAAHTLAFRFAKPTQPFKHARNTVFKLVDQIAGQEELMARITKIGESFIAIGPVSREQMRWALHRMPVRDRLQLIKWIPLNTVLVFQEDEHELQDVAWKSARDRRLAYDLFIEGLCDDELSARYELSVNAVKNVVGELLHGLTEKPLACELAGGFIRKTQSIEPMEVHEIRRHMKHISSHHRAHILEQIPNCAWKAKDVIHLHKHLFLDYFSGEWVLASLVSYYNLEKGKRLTGTFKLDGKLTVRGACAAIEGVLLKIKEQPVLRQMLRDLAEPNTVNPLSGSFEGEPRVEMILPVPLEKNGEESDGYPDISGQAGDEFRIPIPLLEPKAVSDAKRAVAA